MVPQLVTRVAILGLAVGATTLIGARSYTYAIAPKGDAAFCSTAVAAKCSSLSEAHFTTGVISSDDGVTMAVRVRL